MTGNASTLEIACGNDIFTCGIYPVTENGDQAPFVLRFADDHMARSAAALLRAMEANQLYVEFASDGTPIRCNDRFNDLVGENLATCAAMLAERNPGDGTEASALAQIATSVGDAGRGFAVVASEVRALAQRSSEAAREINSLISDSSVHVERGVTLVGETGQALERIVGSVGDISGHVERIAASTQEKSGGLQEINSAMDQLERVTQQNAAMFEQTTAAAKTLDTAAKGLVASVRAFHLNGSGSPATAGQGTGDAWTAASPASSTPALVDGDPAARTQARRGTDGLAPTVPEADLDDDWTDF